MSASSPKEKEKKKKRTIRPEISAPKIQVAKKPKNELSTGRQFSEEDEVEKRDPLDDLKEHKQACSEIRNSIKSISAMKDAGKPDTGEVEELRTQGTLQFLVLKKLNRLAHIRCKKVRDSTNEAKQKIDQYHLQLQNLLYEVMHLQKEITKCLEFKSKDEEIDLVGVEDFYKEAPPEISRPEVTKNDPHQQTLARLEWELEQRKRLSANFKETQNSKNLISQDIKSKKEYLESLQPKLVSIMQATKPVQESLNMRFDEIQEQHQTAQHLPQPLYVLYMQSSAYKEACDKNMAVSIEGDVEAAKTVESQQDQEQDEDSDSDQEEQEQSKRKSKHRRHTTSSDRLEQKREKLLKSHPLTVVLEIKCKEEGTLHLVFSYLLVLKIVTVTVKLLPGKDVVSGNISGSDLLAPDSILTCLYPGDEGKSTPNPANQFELNRLSMDSFSFYISKVGHPYLWVQWLSGLQFLTASPLTNDQVSSSHMEETIRRLRRRVASRLSLQKQLASLEHGSVPVSSEYMSLFPPKISSRLVSWRRSTYDDFAALPYCKHLIDSCLAKDSDLFFTTCAERGSAKLKVEVVVSPDYPRTPPVMAVVLQWRTDHTNLNDVNIRDMEAEVNIHYGELIKGKSHDQLLTNQIQRMLMCFDLFLETEAGNEAMEGPAEFPKEKICPRMTRGPIRSKPYKYLPQMGIFTQR
ncbi:THO complex subunit 5 homolog A-like isoform X1 [Lingula anatina]|uniref:THO complex subunit 5 homolog A-like isoform X1 n=1 Tax=Lingula anatina TaxID=7574 RepID=A0A1S3HQK4_LINAN|nr:THO complex subunit 5 homolog A-like isoform X1 [Lingula anatina]|eukprot:XP_013387821.1 THO complex subunit 5 homolog A-like isoform X1 [Lingula anatina]